MKRLFVDEDGYPRAWWLYVMWALILVGLIIVMIVNMARAFAGGPTDTPEPPPPPSPASVAVPTACGMGTYLEPSLNQCLPLPNPVTAPMPPGYAYPDAQPCNSWYFSVFGISGGQSTGCDYGGWGGGVYPGYYYNGPGYGGGWPGWGFRPGWG